MELEELWLYRRQYESLRTSTSILAEVVSNSAVFVDYRTVSATLLPTASEFAASKRDTLLIVDECPRDVAMDLARAAAASGSLLRVITIDTDDRALDKSVLHISVAPSEGDLIASIIREKNPGIDESTVARLRGFCGGFPRFAVLAATTPNVANIPFETLDDIVDRVLTGSSICSKV